MRLARYLGVAIFVIVLACATCAAQSTGTSWNGPGPSVNVKAFGAFGDMHANNDGQVTSASPNLLTATASSSFTNADIGKHLWIDQARYAAPQLSSATVGTSCMGATLNIGNTASYPIHVYYRLTLTSGSGGTFAEGDASPEGFATINPGTSGQCLTIHTPTGVGSATNYHVYVAWDAPVWIQGSTYSAAVPASMVLDPNGNVELAISGSTGSSNPGSFTKTIGGQTTDTGTLIWENLGPVVPGVGSGGETLQSSAANCNSGNPALGHSCEIDSFQNNGGAPPFPHFFDAGTVTGFTATTLTFSTALTLPSSTSISNATYAWGHDDLVPITNALNTLLSTTASGGTLFFPMSNGCYAITGPIVASSNDSFLRFEGEGSASSK